MPTTDAKTARDGTGNHASGGAAYLPLVSCFSEEAPDKKVVHMTPTLPPYGLCVCDARRLS